MSIQFPCGGCGSNLTISQEHAGKKVKCPTCQRVSQVPANPSRPASDQPSKNNASLLKLKCGGCGKIVKAPRSMAGKKVKCPGCQSPFVVPGQPSITTPPSAPAPSAPAPSATPPGAPRPVSAVEDPFAMPTDGPMGFDDPLGLPAGQVGTPVNNPFASPGYAASAASNNARRQPAGRNNATNPLLLPAIFLIVFSSITVLSMVVQLGMMTIGLVAISQRPGVNLAPEFSGIFMQYAVRLAIGLTNTVIIVGSVKMIQLKDYRSAFFASIIGMLPICGGCFILSIPFAVWACVLLNEPNVKRRFKNK